MNSCLKAPISKRINLCAFVWTKNRGGREPSGLVNGQNSYAGVCVTYTCKWNVKTVYIQCILKESWPKGSRTACSNLLIIQSQFDWEELPEIKAMSANVSFFHLKAFP